MTSFHDNKVIHLISMALFIMTTCIYLINRKKLYAYLHGLSGILVLLSGVYLAHTLGMNLKNPAKWIMLKGLIWLFLIMIPPIIKKRAAKLSEFFMWISIILAMIAVAVSVYKPLFL